MIDNRLLVAGAVLIGVLLLIQSGPGIDIPGFDDIIPAETKVIVTASGSSYDAKRPDGSLVASGSDLGTVLVASFNALTPGRTLLKEKVLLKGSFTLTSTINMANYCILELDGKMTRASGANCEMIHAVGKHHFEIKGGEWDGAKAANSGTSKGILLENCNNWSIHDLVIHDTTAASLYAVSSPYGTIQRVETYNHGGGIFLVWTSDCKILDSKFHDCTQGIYLFCHKDGVVQHCDRNVISGNTLYRIGRDGISLYPEGIEDSVSHCTVTKNKLYDVGIGDGGTALAIAWGSYSYDVGKADHNTVTDNEVYTTHTYSKSAYPLGIRGNYNQILRNNIHDEIHVPMQILRANHNTIEDNTFDGYSGGLAYAAATIEDSSDNVIKNNHWLNAATDGIQFRLNKLGKGYASSRNDIDGNDFTDILTVFGYWVNIGNSIHADNQIRNNIFHGTHAGTGIRDLGTGTVISNNTIS